MCGPEWDSGSGGCQKRLDSRCPMQAELTGSDRSVKREKSREIEEAEFTPPWPDLLDRQRWAGLWGGRAGTWFWPCGFQGVRHPGGAS